MDQSDLALLRAYEPVVRFTQGEYFFPVSVERYVEQAWLWSAASDGEPGQPLAAGGTLDIDSLAGMGATSQGIGRSLSGIFTGTKAKRTRLPASQRPPRLRGGSRLAAVGLMARLVDALNRLSLLFRGSVAGGSAARSYLLQQQHLGVDEPTYYGRVVRDGSWIICQYWFFYSFNNWRSAFGGVNEHEADWEQVTVYLDGTDPLDPTGGTSTGSALPEPRWVVFSAHDETGDDLRRRWDDPDLGLVDGRHPIVYAGAGSHSGAYLAGDYLITINPPRMRGLVAAVRWLSRVLAPWSDAEADEGVGIPYIDYARGDGRAIGPDQPEAWNPVVIDEATGWVRQYRGLWGHDTRDRLGGERGPAGPRYERNGTVRQSWADPVGWAGLAKVAPNRAVEAQLIAARVAEIQQQSLALGAQIAQEQSELARTAAGLAPAAPEVRALAPTEEDLLAKRMELVALRDEGARMAAVTAADLPDPGPHAHLRHRRTPMAPEAGVRAHLLSWWAVLSTPAILWFAGSVIDPETAGYRASAALVAIVFLLVIEGLARGRFLQLMLRLAMLVVIAIGAYYLWVDWRIVASLALSVTAVIVLVLNLRDALRR